MNEQPAKIYLLPNLMTAGNLFCGFTATLKILEGALLQSTNADLASDRFHEAIWFVLGAFVFDFLDGRIARLGGHDTTFGREFDSLADIVSFGLAPALMVYRVVLNEFPNACWIIAFVYLACGALRLARFNTASANHEREASTNGAKSFTGFPIPAAAGLIASITLFLLWLAEGEHHLGKWKFVLPPLLLFLSFMMFSRFEYPSFKAINWKTQKSIPRFLVISLLLFSRRCFTNGCRPFSSSVTCSTVFSGRGSRANGAAKSKKKSAKKAPKIRLSKRRKIAAAAML